MKLVTTAQQLRSALGLFRNIIERRNAYPVLGAVLFDGAKVRGTNLDQELIVSIVASEAKGRAAIDYRTLSRLIAFVPADDEVRIEAGTDSATVSFPGGRYDLLCIEPGAYPELKGSGQGALEAIPGDGLRSALSFVAPSISTEDTRYYLNGFSFQRDRSGTSVLVTTDGHRMSVMPFATESWIDGKIVPTLAAKALLRMPEPQRIQRLPSDAHIRFAWSGMTLTTKLIEGTFPDWQRVLPKIDPATSSIAFDRNELARACGRMAAIHPGKQPYVSIAFDRRGAALSMRSADAGTGREFLTKAIVENVNGESLVTFNAEYLLSLLKSFASHDALRLYVIDASSTARLSVPGQEAFSILMPARGQDDKLAFDTLHEIAAIGRAA